jgi:hypothetical protein
MAKKGISEKVVSLNELLKSQESDQPRPEKVLNLLETELKNLIQQKKALKTKFNSKFREIQG